MKRVKKRSKKRDESNEENDPFSIVPLDMKVDILMKLPPRSLARLCFVSDPRQRFHRVVPDSFFDPATSSLLGVRWRRHVLPLLLSGGPSSDHRTVSYTLNSNLRYLPYTFSQLIRSLICGRNKTRVIIGNPSTSQFVSLLGVKNRSYDILSVFGYEPVNDLYKVLLCMNVIMKRRGMRDVSFDHNIDHNIMWKEHQVITLGAKEKLRMIECKYANRPYSGSKGICRDGVVYYLASFKGKCSLMSFDMRSEEFNVTKIPEDDNLQMYRKLVNHTGKISIASQVAYKGPVELWVLEDAKKEVWSNAASVFPSWADVFGRDQRFLFSGICSYDLKKNMPRKL